MSRYTVIVRGQAAPNGLVAQEVHSAPGDTPPPEFTPDEPRTCQATTKGGDPCNGRPGDDGFCAAHKPKEGDGDLQEPAVAAYQAEAGQH